MAKLYDSGPGIVRVYHNRQPSPDGRFAVLNNCLTVFLVFMAAFGMFVTALAWLSPFFHDFFERHDENGALLGVPLVVGSLVMLVFNVNRGYLEFREDERAIFKRGAIGKTRLADFAEIGDIRMETLRLDNGGTMFRYLIFWKDEPLKNPLPLSSPVDSAHRLDTHRREIEPLLRQMLARSAAGGTAAGPAIPRATVRAKPFFSRRGTVYSRVYLFEPALWICLAAGAGTWGYLADYEWFYRIVLAAIALGFCVAVFFEHVALRIDTETRTIVEHTCLGLRKRKYPLTAFGKFLVMHMPPLVEISLRSLEDAGPKITIGTFLSFERAKEVLLETAIITDIDLDKQA